MSFGGGIGRTYIFHCVVFYRIRGVPLLLENVIGQVIREKEILMSFKRPKWNIRPIVLGTDLARIKETYRKVVDVQNLKWLDV